MNTTKTPLFDLTASDLMTPAAVTLPEKMSLQDAARLLTGPATHSAPVVDAAGHCVGVLSVADLATWAAREHFPAAAVSACVYTEWQSFEQMPAAEDIRHCMTTHPPTVDPHATLGQIARIMADAGLDRVIVLGADGEPAGVVSASDLIAALARCAQADTD
jgi:CBS domain-containing protein